MQTKQMDKAEKLGWLSLLVIVLSIYVLVALLIDTFFKLPPEISKILNVVDNCICFVFLYDFVRNFRSAPNKLRFMRWGWIDLIASIPIFDNLRAGRALRLIRLLRIVRAFRSVRHLLNHVFKNRVQGTFSAAIIVALLMLIFSAIAILQVEDAPNSNIKGAEDALWWAFTTITTVGYGDKYPVTTEGRIITAALMTVGVGLFGVFTGFLASWFVGGNKKAATSSEDNTDSP